MALQIQTTGLEQYAKGGSARIKVLIVGGPGVGKTRWASYFPAPIYADCEKGLASVADRNVPFVSVTNSQEMLDLLSFLKLECRQPVQSRRYQTIVVDTLDAFARKIKDEWLEKEKKQAFNGWEAWGYLNGRMQMLLTRLLNLDMNVVVLVHHKDKTSKDDATGRETHELMPQLQGETADMIFNDFDLVAWLGTEWKAVDGERKRIRTLTFEATPDKPFLKDRLFVMPKSIEVTFDPSDYTTLLEAVEARVKDLTAGETIGEIPTAVEEAPKSAFVMAPGAAGSGALPATDPKPLPIAQMDKPALMKAARDRGVTHALNGQPIKTNTLKSELIEALEAHERGESPQPPTSTQASVGTATASASAEPVANPTRTRQLKTVAEGQVDTRTGELVEAPTREQAVATLTQELGAEITEDKAVPVAPTPVPTSAPAPAKPKEAHVCADCGLDLTDENPDIVKLSYIRFRKRYCAEHYAQHKSK